METTSLPRDGTPNSHACLHASSGRAAVLEIPRGADLTSLSFPGFFSSACLPFLVAFVAWSSQVFYVESPNFSGCHSHG